MKAVYEHELTMYSHDFRTYVFASFLLLFTGLGALIYNINSSIANFEYVLGYISVVLVIIVPLLTMKVISDEKKQKTDQLLLSLPLSTTDIILGKFFALATVFTIPMLIIFIYPLIFKNFGDVYIPASYGALVAFLFLGFALLSIGMFISSLTESQGMAAGICVFVMLFLYFSGTLADYVSSSIVGSVIGISLIALLIALAVRMLTKSGIIALASVFIFASAITVALLTSSETFDGLLPDMMNKLSLFERFYTFVDGVFDLTGIVYFISVTVFFLFLCVQSLENRRYNG